MSLTNRILNLFFSLTLFSVQEKRINTFHLRYLDRFFRITWQQQIINNKVLRRTKLTTCTLPLVSAGFADLVIF